MPTLKNRIIVLLFFACSCACAQSGVYKIADLQHRIGDPDTLYVVNFWATWCKPCIKELPAFDSLHVLTKGKAIKVLLVSLDFKEDLSGRLIPFLKKNGIKAECVVLDESNGNDFINAINPAWSGAIPATLVKKGESTRFAERPLKLKDIQALLEGI